MLLAAESTPENLKEFSDADADHDAVEDGI